MRLPRFSIASLLVIIGILGVALAALRNPSYLWANVLFTVAFGSLILAVVNAIYGSGAGRAYWLGFTICGGAYFAACSIPGLRDSVSPRLVSELLFDVLYPSFRLPEPTPSPAPARGMMAMMGQMQMTGMMNQMQGGLGPNGGNGVRKRRGPGTAVTPVSAASRWSTWNEPGRAIGVNYQIGNVILISPEAFRQIGHSLVTLLLAVLGGVYARSRYRAWAATDVPASGIDQDLA
jgi:hypothetical protein